MAGSSIGEGRFVLKEAAEAKLFIEGDGGLDGEGGLGLFFLQASTDTGEVGQLRICVPVLSTKLITRELVLPVLSLTILKTLFLFLILTTRLTSI